MEIKDQIKEAEDIVKSAFPAQSTFMLNCSSTISLINILVDKGIITREEYDKEYLRCVKITARIIKDKI